MSGPADCENYEAEKATCPMLTALGGDYLNWNCYLGATPINPYSGVLPVGTICKQSCPSWKSAETGEQSQFESTCELVAGVAGWSTTTTHDGKLINHFDATFPQPDADENSAWQCNCVPLELKWPYDPTGLTGNFYDPNDEEAADFICNQSLGDAAWTIDGSNSCSLYCDQHYVATAECVDGEWTGNPEWGFWCYDEPTQVN